MRTHKLLFVLLLLAGAATHPAFAQSKKPQWVDSVFQRMSLDDKIGQLFMVPATPESFDDAEDEIKNHKIGGVVFRGGGPVWQAKMINAFQASSATPLFMGLDSGWQPNVCMDSAVNFPNPLVLGAIQDDNIIYSIARTSGRAMRELGIHISFDLPSEILRDTRASTKTRCFGSNSTRVIPKAVSYLKGLNDEGILSCPQYIKLKGVTIVGIDKDLPTIQATIDSTDAYLYRQLIKNKLSAILPTPVDLPLFYEKKADARKNKLSTSAISALYTGGWIRKHFDFNGLTFVDIDKANTATDYKAGEAELLAVRAGNDMLITTDDVGVAIRRIKKFLRKEESFLPRLDSTVKRILAAKYDAGLYAKKVANTENLVKRIASPQTQIFKQHLYEAAITVVRNTDSLLPLRSLESKNIAFVTSQKDAQSDQLHRLLSKYVEMPYVVISGTNDHSKIDQVMKGYDVIIAGVFPETLLDEFLPVLKNLVATKSVITCDFGHPTFIQYAGDFTATVVGYTNEPEMVHAVPQMIFGGIGASGALPYTVSASLPEGTGSKVKPSGRFRYTIPEDARMDSRTLDKIERIAHEAIKTGATPGCHVLVAKDGKVVYDRSFGYLTYEKKAAVTDETIYDLASVTKVSATLQAVMFMYEKGIIDINKKASYYLPELKHSNKKDYTLKDILTHQAGLWPFLPFWAQTVKDNDFMPAFYSRNLSDDYPYTVADHLYASRSMRDSLWNWIVKAKVRDKPDRTPFDYRYSDMGFYILQHLAEKLLNQPIDDFLEQNLYGPLGASTLGYLPLQRFDASRIAPTENDKIFRKSLLIGMVHDQGAAMMGGVAGHAGLFSDATDLAKLGQMLLQEGSYGGYQFYKPETVRTFTQKQFATSRRGLGWDKPVSGEWNGPTSAYASQKTFGHTGFTGTCIWVDPEFNIVYIFLSNRVHPDMTNNKLISENTRSRIQDAIYESIFEYCRYN